MSETEHTPSGEESAPEPEGPTGPEAESDGRRTRSTIGFPYGALSDAEMVADALHHRGGKASMDELAGEMGTTVTSGTFRTRVATARIFGVVEVKRGQVSLTPLGHRLLDPERAPKARVEAFLHVPLFERIYEEYKGRLLPPASGLEAEMTRLGVSPKQTDRARQALQRSAEQAGFSRSGKDRLVAPALDGPGGQEPPHNRPAEQPPQDLPADMPRMIVEMWRHLLEGGQTMTAEQIKTYVDGARTVWQSLPR